MININDTEENQVIFLITPGNLIKDEQLNKCSAFYSENYGTWSKCAKNQKPGEQSKMTCKEMKEQLLFDSNNCKVVMALTKDNDLVGTCFSYSYQCQSLGPVKLITQIVVKENWRNHNIAQKMILYSIGIPITDWKCAGVISPHPFSVLALEKATHLKCNPDQICKNSQELLTNCQIPFVKNNTNKLKCSSTNSTLNTEFYIDHSQALKDLEEIKKHTDWKLGTLEEGCEFFAFVFNH